MQGKLPGRTRRGILTAGVLGAIGGFAASRPERSLRIVPEVHEARRHGTMEEAETDPLADALQQKTETLQGFDPMTFLTSFDTGEVRRLPDGRKLREFELIAEDVDLEVAPGVFYPAWTYGGTVPGPTLRCTEGDLVRVRFINRSISDHTIHFHGIHSAVMDGVAEIVPPDGSYLYEFVARPAGLQLYHCHVPPVDLHMSRGLFGAFLIDPRRPRTAATEMLMVCHGWDLDFDASNEIYALNGPANFYRDHPIRIHSGETVRLYFVNALEFEPVSSFHLHANFFRLDRTGQKRRPDELADMITLSQAERCVMEFSYQDPGRYMFHPHQNRFAERGAMGFFEVV